LHEGGERLTMAHFGLAQDLPEGRIGAETNGPRWRERLAILSKPAACV
jgi:hypothetical protein